jgi:transcriptional regulator with XRE-family HTH domain
MKIAEDDLYLYVGVKLRKARTALGATQRDVGDAVGLSQHSISNIEAGRQRIRLDELYDICMYLKLDPLETLPTKAEVTTSPTEHKVLIGKNLVSLTKKEAERSVRKLNRLIGKK